MATSTQSPPILPISNPPNPNSSAATTTAPISSPATRLFLSRLLSSLRSSLAHRRPWLELVDRSAFSRPDSLSLALSRVKSNLSYFRINYAVFLSLVLAFSLLSHPFSLLLILSLLAAWCCLYIFRPSDPPLVILNRHFSDRETLGGLALLSVLVFFMTSVGSLLISAVMVGAAIVCLHGAFRVPEDLFLDEQEAGGATAGLLSFLGGGAGSVGGVRV